MRIRIVGILLCCCLLLTGCASMLHREYSVVELHSRKYWESDAGDTLRAENYQDIVNDLLMLVTEHTEQATLRLYDDSGEMVVTNLLERAATEVQNETPLGAYAVEYITTEIEAQRGYYEVTVRLGYRRTKEQVKAIVNATSTAALADLLDAAMESNRKELAVRIGYWSDADEERVQDTILMIEAEWDLTDRWIWAAEYYPSAADVGLIEFRLVTAPPRPEHPPEDGETLPEGTEPPGESAENPGESGENEGGQSGEKENDGESAFAGDTGTGAGEPGNLPADGETSAEPAGETGKN